MWLSAFGPIHKNVGGENYGLSSLDYRVLSAELGESLFRHNVAEAILKSFRSVDTNTQSTQKKKTYDNTPTPSTFSCPSSRYKSPSSVSLSSCNVGSLTNLAMSPVVRFGATGADVG